MTRDTQRIERIVQALVTADLDVLVCALPANVLLLTGYWPVVGTSLALATRDGRFILIVPEDEEALAEAGWADDLRTFHPGSLERLTDAEDAIQEPLLDAGRAIGAHPRRVGYEHGGTFEPISYAAIHLYGSVIQELLKRAFPSATLVSADALLADLRAEKTTDEIDHIRSACSVAAHAFVEGSRQLRAGLREVEAAVQFRTPLSTLAASREGLARADGFVYCMSGPNSADACGAYARSRERHMAQGDFALFHCNSYVDGYWTDITRTYCLGEPSSRQAAMYAAVLAASAAALDTIRPGVRGQEVDRAARNVLAERGFGDQFKHSTGHGVGFAAIDHNARPRLHPASDDVLKSGMVFNVEPAIYRNGYGGLRHCDMVAVTAAGAEVLTRFQSQADQLQIG